MSNSGTLDRAGKDRTDLYSDITHTIIKQLEAGRLPWVQPWGKVEGGAELGLPKNASTCRAYSGINILILWGAVFERGFTGQSWLTFKQALDLGGNVRKGERGTQIVYADTFIPEKERMRSEQSGQDAVSIPFLKRFTVFNTDQCEGLSEDIRSSVSPVPEGMIEARVEALIKATGIEFRIGGNKAFYSPSHDFVQVPPPQAYFEPINWHRTALHEMGHATGHSNRLNRNQSGSFGSKDYAFEELIAEIASAFLCASLDIVPTVRHADYIGSWHEVLKNDNRAIFRAARAASKSADYLLAFVTNDDDVSKCRHYDQSQSKDRNSWIGTAPPLDNS